MDIYSLGVILYTCLTGQIMKVIVTQETENKNPNTSYDFNSDIAFQKLSREAQNLIKELTELNPSKRPSALEALKKDWFKIEKSNSTNKLQSPEENIKKSNLK